MVEFTAEGGIGIEQDRHRGTHLDHPGFHLAFVGRPVGGLTIGCLAYVVPDSMDSYGGVGSTVGYLGRPHERLALGVAAQGGWFFGSLGIPASVRVGPGLWMWVQPTGVMSERPGWMLPLGLSLETRGDVVFSIQAALSTLGYYDNERNLHLGLSVSPRIRRHRSPGSPADEQGFGDGITQGSAPFTSATPWQ